MPLTTDMSHNWTCPACRHKVSQRYGACPECGRSKKADVGSRYSSRRKLARAGIVAKGLPKRARAMIKIGPRRPKEEKPSEDAAVDLAV